MQQARTAYPAKNYPRRGQPMNAGARTVAKPYALQNQKGSNSKNEDEKKVRPSQNRGTRNHNCDCSPIFGGKGLARCSGSNPWSPGRVYCRPPPSAYRTGGSTQTVAGVGYSLILPHTTDFGLFCYPWGYPELLISRFIPME
jgi:hypothetical protein